MRTVHVYNETQPFKDITWVPHKLVNVVPTKIINVLLVANCYIAQCFDGRLELF